MAKVLIGTTFFPGRGRGTIFQYSPYGPILRTYKTPRNPQTVQTQGYRSRFSVAATNWRLLTSSQQAAWNAAAGTFTSGFKLFMSTNAIVLQYGGSLFLMPPSRVAFPGVLVSGTIPSWNVGGISWTLTPLTPPSGYNIELLYSIWLPNATTPQQIVLRPAPFFGYSWSAGIFDLVVHPFLTAPPSWPQAFATLQLRFIELSSGQVDYSNFFRVSN